jgi:hypothetical protein
LNAVFVDIRGLTLDFTGWEVLQRFDRGAERSFKGFLFTVFSNPPVRLDWVFLQR